MNKDLIKLDDFVSYEEHMIIASSIQKEDSIPYLHKKLTFVFKPIKRLKLGEQQLPGYYTVTDRHGKIVHVSDYLPLAITAYNKV
jgi:hypothetical protein